MWLLSPNWEECIMLTAFDYMYRDAGNFKAFGAVLIEGSLNEAERNSILFLFFCGWRVLHRPNPGRCAAALRAALPME